MLVADPETTHQLPSALFSSMVAGAMVLNLVPTNISLESQVATLPETALAGTMLP
jgi:hypothetical protein